MEIFFFKDELGLLFKGEFSYIPLVGDPLLIDGVPYKIVDATPILNYPEDPFINCHIERIYESMV